MTAFNIFIWSQVCDFHPLAEGSKRIQSFLVLGGVTHHGVVAASSLQQGGNTRGRGDQSKLSIHQPLKHPNWVYFVPANQTGHQKQRISQTYSAWVALQKFDFLIEFDVICSQAVQFILQGLHGLLHGATLLQASEGTKGRGISPPGKETHEYTCVRARIYVCDSQLPAPGCESGTSPFGWRWWRAASPSGPEEAQAGRSNLNLQIKQHLHAGNLFLYLHG